MRNRANNGTPDERAAAQALIERLPMGWSVELQAGAGDGPFLALRAPDGRGASLAVLSRKRVLPRDVSDLVRQGTERGSPLLLVAPFLGSRARQLLAEANASYVDCTGNLRVVVDDPAIFLEGSGADRDPDRRPRALRSLRGATAGRVVRALCDFVPPYGVRTLAEISSTSLGTVSRVVSFLEEEALITRDNRRRIVQVDWAGLIVRWVDDYSLTGSNLLRSYLEPRGLSALGSKIRTLGRYAVTGSLAGPGIAPVRLAMLYVDDATAAAAALGVVPTEVGANVWLLEPFDDVVFERTGSRPFAPSPQTAVVVAAGPSQVAADLLTSPGRGPQEGEALIEVLKGSEDAWRHRT